MNTMEYTHQKLNEDLYGLAGYYTPQREVRLKYNNREVLYVIGQVVIEVSCCGNTSWRYGLVPGYIVNWQNKRGGDGMPVSEVEPIPDEETRNNIKQIIQGEETGAQVQFWQAL